MASRYASGTASAPIDDDDAPSKPREVESCREVPLGRPLSPGNPTLFALSSCPTWPHFEDHKFPHGLAYPIFSAGPEDHERRDHAVNLEKRLALA